MAPRSRRQHREDSDEPIDDEDEQQSEEEAPRAVVHSKKAKTEKRRQLKNTGGDEEEEEEEANYIDVANFKDQPIDPEKAGAIHGLADDWKTVQKHIRGVAPNLIRDVTLAMAGVTEGDELMQSLDELDTVLRELLDVDDEMSGHQEVLQAIAESVGEGAAGGDIIEQYEKGAKERVNGYRMKTTRQKYSKREEYVEFKHLVFENTHDNQAPPPISQLIEKEEGDDSDDDDDFEMGGVTQDFKCPLSLTIFKDPYTSTTCNHTFSKVAIKDYLAQGPGGIQECPTAGCGSELTMAKMKPDSNMAKRAQAYERRQKKAAEKSDEEESDDDVIE